MMVQGNNGFPNPTTLFISQEIRIVGKCFTEEEVILKSVPTRFRTICLVTFNLFLAVVYNHSQESYNAGSLWLNYHCYSIYE